MSARTLTRATPADRPRLDAAGPKAHDPHVLTLWKSLVDEDTLIGRMNDCRTNGIEELVSKA